MVIFHIPFLIPRFNWQREIRGFKRFLGYYAVRAQRVQEQVKDVGRQERRAKARVRR